MLKTFCHFFFVFSAYNYTVNIIIPTRQKLNEILTNVIIQHIILVRTNCGRQNNYGYLKTAAVRNNRGYLNTAAVRRYSTERHRTRWLKT